jgi:surfactin synthase thioesterase subunit
MSILRTSDRWVRRFHTAPDDAPRLVCFPHAGGSAAWYSPFSAVAHPSVQVLAVQYPGRLDRYGDPLVDDLEVLADQVVEALAPDRDRPPALFGHSMGAVLAFEVARRLEAASTPVTRLFVSGRRAPDVDADDHVHLLPDEDLIDAIESLGGVPPGVLRNPDVRALFLPPVRSDYRAVETYRYRPGPPLSAPITALVGDRDPVADLEQTRAWLNHTSGGGDVRVFAGDHFFPVEHWSAVADLVRESLPRGGNDASPA